MLGKSLIQAAAVKAGAAGGLGIEELFQTWLYTGNGSTQTITNGIDLAGEGGLVWIKQRNGTNAHNLFDTSRGVNEVLFSSGTDGSNNLPGRIVSFDNSGFTLGSAVATNGSGSALTSWTFRKAPGFFDVVTYTGTGSAQAISHNLGSAPGFIVAKRTDGISDWIVYHQSRGATKVLTLNSTGAEFTAGHWDSTAPTSTHFYVGGGGVSNNISGATYVAYLFARDEQIFGEGGDQSVIKCGSFTTNGSGAATVNLGWEPQWGLVKSISSSNWYMVDTMRGWVTGNNNQHLYANLSNAEGSYSGVGNPTSDGFYADNLNASQTYIYIAIRRGPMKTPTSGTEVFLPSVTARNIEYTVGFPPDMAISKTRFATDPSWVGDRLRGNYPTLKTESTAAEQTGFLSWTFDATTGRWKDILSNDPIQYLFRRAPGFFDVVAYTGTGAARTVAHNLGVAPELMIVKSRSAVGQWCVYSSSLGIDYRLFLQLTDAAYSSSSAFWNATVPTSSVFSIGTNGNVNTSAATYIAYLFATLPGISKVFSFTGNGTSQTINCGFAAGARFVLLKRTDSAGNWLVADTARGIISGNDPLLYLNSTAAEITTLDWIDPHSSGFIVNQEATANANVGGATYIGLAIA